MIAGNDPAGGHVGMVSNGELVPAGGSDPRNVFGIGSGLEFESAFGMVSDMEFGTRFGIALDWPFGIGSNSPVAGLWPSGIACH